MTKTFSFIITWIVFLWLGATLLNLEAFYVLAAILGATVVVSFLIFIGAGKGMEARRVSLGAVRQGDKLSMRIILSAKKRHPQGHFVMYDTNPAIDDYPPYIWVSGVGSNSDAEIAYDFKADIRGEHKLGPIKVRVCDPLGLFRRTISVPCEGNLTVLPKWEALRTLPMMSRYQTCLAGGKQSTVEGEGQEFFGVREYRRGDGLRRIHWGVTAKTDQLTVRQLESELRPNISLFVDRSRPVDWEMSGSGHLDRCTAVAASIGVYAMSTGSRLNCWAGGGLHSRFNRGDQERFLFLRFLAELEPDKPGVCGAHLSETMHGIRGGDTLLAIVSSLDEHAVAVLSGFAYSGIPVTLFYVDSVEKTEETEEARMQAGRYIHGLISLGVDVVRVEDGDRLDLAMKAWL